MKKFTNKIVFALVTTSLIFLAACGDDDKDNKAGGGGGGGFSTGLPKDKKLKDLTKEEDKQAAEASEKYFDDPVFNNNICNAIAAFTLSYSIEYIEDEEELRTLCAETFDDCLNDEPEEDGGDVETGYPENCEATVGDVELCMVELVASRKAAFADAIPCDKLTIEDVKNFDASVMGPPETLSPACQAAEDKCPGLYTYDEEDDE